MDVASEVEALDPATKILSLDIRQISDLAPLLPALARLRLEELSLYGNRIKELPLDLSSLRALRSLDISNNLLGNMELVLLSLKTLPALTTLTINLRSKDQELKIKNQLPRLQILNGKEIRRKRKRDSTVNLTQEDLEKIAEIYDLIRELFRGVDPAADKQLADEFDQTVKQVMEELTFRLRNDSRRGGAKSILIAKRELIQLCVRKYLAFTKARIPQLYEVLKLSNELEAELDGNLLALIQDESTGKSSPEGSRRKEPARPEPQPKEPPRQQLRDQTMQVFKARISELEQELQQLEAENRRYLEVMIRHAKGDKLAYPSEVDKDSYSYSRRRPEEDLSGGRVLTCRQLREVIEEMYHSKVKSDARQQEIKGARETMEQHMYTFLIQKYGLKNLVVQWAGSIVSAVKRFAAEDPDVALFGKILRNQCEEDFRALQEQVRSSINQLLKMHERGKHPLKSTLELNQLVSHKQSSTLNKDEAYEIVRYMYSESDSRQLIDILDRKVQRGKKVDPQSLKKLTREQQIELLADSQTPRIAFSQFVNTLLEFQLRKHDQFLSYFIGQFQQFDTDKNGILSEQEFRDLAKVLGSSTKATQRYLTEIDPFNNEKITFSQCVQVFSTEGFEEQGQPLLEKVAKRR